MGLIVKFDLTSFIIGVISSLIAGFLQPTIREAIISVFRLMAQKIWPDKIDLTGRWESQFSEPDENLQEIITTEHIDLVHRGDKFTATVYMETPYRREFDYCGNVYNNILWGIYKDKKAQKGAIAGRGIFLLQIDDTRKRMDGVCAWIDKHSKKAEGSRYKWVKKV